MTTMGETNNAATGRGHGAEPLMRASDVDRLATVRVLQEAVARGLLTPDEGSERMAAAFGAVHVVELGPLTADLPAAPGKAAPPGWRPLATMAMEQVRASLRGPATGRLSPARIAAALLIAFFVMSILGSITGAMFFDDGGSGYHHHHGGFDFDDD